MTSFQMKALCIGIVTTCVSLWQGTSLAVAQPPTPPASVKPNSQPPANGAISVIYATPTAWFISLRPKHEEIEYYRIDPSQPGSAAMLATVQQAVERSQTVWIYYQPASGNTVDATAIILQIPERKGLAKQSTPMGHIDRFAPCGNVQGKPVIDVAATISVVSRPTSATAFMFYLKCQIKPTSGAVIDEYTTSQLVESGQSRVISVGGQVKLDKATYKLLATVSYLDPATNRLVMLEERECEFTVQ
jgi:hypothetical protein